MCVFTNFIIWGGEEKICWAVLCADKQINLSPVNRRTHAGCQGVATGTALGVMSFWWLPGLYFGREA